MNSFAIMFLLANSAMLLLLPRRWASLPLLIGACYMTLAQGIDVGPFSFTVIRILVAAGILRIFIRREGLSAGMNNLDWIIVIWAIWALISSTFHKTPSEALIFRLGLVYNTCGIYLMLRVFCQTMDDLRSLIYITAFLLFPVALEMIYEHLSYHNLFSTLGGVPVSPAIRDGNIRAQGSFQHPILAGTVGAVCLPLMVGVWNQNRKLAMIGIFSCVAMVFCSSSSGPIASALAGIGGLFLWHYRHRMRLVRWVAVIGYIALDLVMKAPAYFLMARVPIVSGSTGWHRATLLQSAFKHLSEWWLAGTDYTRHWMVTGVSWSPDHADITNHYIKMGVIGGLPLMIVFIIILAKGFSYVGQVLQKTCDDLSGASFLVWALGASLFAHAATMISVSYFDQSFLFLYLTLAAIGSIWSWSTSMELQEKGTGISAASQD